MLAKALKQMKKTTCFTGESINDCFSIEESDIGLTMSNYGAEYCNRICDLSIDRDVMLIYESIKLGRSLFENIRKYI
jgi:P-type E1-E2 ATPase